MNTECFPFLFIFFPFFYPCFQFLCTNLSLLQFYLFLSILLFLEVLQDDFLNFLFRQFMFSVQKCNCLLHLDFELHNFILRFLTVISNNFFVWNIQDFLYITLCHKERRKFHFFPSDLDAFYFFYLPNCSGWISSTMLSKSSRMGHPCLDPDLKRKVFSFLPFYMILAISFLIYSLYYVEIISFYLWL